ncbi:FecR domain-containing protein [Flavobacterium pallidum]|uniref:Uncharacterized protein n=1 Tax=Flavobacterium pallidum TaxID=2172098 RepID=A0A2S1SH71_9FLAO|nr:FecR domain-containing protein [Flavobacterium pallidum]AWI25697.1 hypothetical protein HYN49_07170 [Flavobacterium pallidum]
MENHETYLAEWFEDRMTDAELQQIISKEEFLYYQKIKNVLSGYHLETPGVETHFQSIKEKLQAVPENKTRVIPLWKYLSAAASVLILIAIGFYAFDDNTVATGFGQQQSVTLADHSTVRIAAKSSLSYSNLFQYSRNLCLKGEAYFEVAKGSKFTVNTSLGKVVVLGTKFNVIASGSYFEVHCDEGMVSVTSGSGTVVLKPGRSVSFYKDKFTEWNQETKSVTDESSFFKTPAEVVFGKIKNQYGIKINYPESVKNIGFTGAISHTDLNKAMQSICLPLGLKYKASRPDTIEVTNE